MLDQSHAEFPKTRWSLIDAIINGDQSERQTALETLARIYWPAIYGYVRKKGRDRHEAMELTQAFFADVVLDRNLFMRADRATGSLRSFLLVALKRFLIDQHRRQHSGTLGLLVSMEEVCGEDEALLEHSPSDDPDMMFERRWALAALEEALRRCQEHYRHVGKSKHWEAFDARIVRPSLAMRPPPSHEQIAQELGLEGADACVAAVRVVRKRLLALLQQVVAEATSNPADQEAEYRGVVALLS